MAGHTPGPWSFFVPDADWVGRRTHDWAITVNDHDTWVCEGPTWDAEFQRESHANGRLISAAPELLAEMEACRRFLEDMHTQTVEWTVAESQRRHDAVCAAIAKATGATP